MLFQNAVSRARPTVPTKCRALIIRRQYFIYLARFQPPDEDVLAIFATRRHAAAVELPITIK